MDHRPTRAAIPDGLPDAAIRLAPDARVLELNDLAVTMFQAEHLTLPCALESLFPAGRSIAVRIHASGATQGLRLRAEGRRANGVPFAVDLSSRRQPTGFLLFAREIVHDRALGEPQLYFDVAFETAPIGMALFNTDGEYTRVNETLCGILGRSAEELIGRRDQEFTHPDDRQADIDQAWRVLRGEIATSQCEKRFVRPDGSIVWTIANLTFLRDASGHPLSWVGQFQEITESKLREQELESLADLDPLTGARNRRSFERRFGELARTKQPGALLVVDVDDFKSINDRFGHPVGDRYLIEVAKALRATVRHTDEIARLGGDEFAVLLPGASRAIADAVAATITRAVESISVEGATASASIGISVLDQQPSGSLDRALVEADAAMYRAKARLTRTAFLTDSAP